jgi:hypothetical protein
MNTIKPTFKELVEPEHRMVIKVSVTWLGIIAPKQYSVMKKLCMLLL